MGAQVMLKFHRAADLFPLLKDTDPAQWDEFCDSIRAGLLEPIVVHEEEILDGRNRFLACIETGQMPRFVEFASLNLGEVMPHHYAFTRNYDRRDLTPDQRLAIMAQYMEMDREEALKRKESVMKKGGPGRGHKKPLMDSSEVFANDDGTTRAKLAKAAKVSEHKAQQALNVQRDAHELLVKVARGEIKLSDALKQVAQAAPAKPRRARRKADPVQKATKQLVKMCLTIEPGLKDAVASIDPKDRVFIARSLEIFAEALRASLNNEREAA